MGNNEEGKSSKSDKSSSPAPSDQNNIHVYPDWATMQAYYGPRVALPPYYNSAVVSGHTHHGPHGPPPYMWGPPQHLMSPYGTPYAAIYSPGGIYAHPAVPLGSSPRQGVLSSPAVAPPPSIDTPTKSTGNSDQGLMKKLKRFDGLAMSIGNGNAESGEEGDEQRLSHRTNSTDTSEGSSDGSNGNTDRADHTGKKRSRETPTNGAAGKTEIQANPTTAEEAHVAIPSKVLMESVSPTSVPGMATTLELRNPSIMNTTSSTAVPQSGSVMPPETWLKNERELKRERRKQSNRESARRSRLRKQAETEELAKKVESLVAENVGLKSEINKLMEKSEKLRHENSTFMEKLKKAKLGESTENLLLRVNNPSHGARSPEEKGDRYEKKSGAKLHQLLGAKPMAGAVVAG